MTTSAGDGASSTELWLDRCAAPTVGPRRWGAYFVCGCAGWLAGLALVTWLGAVAQLGATARLVLALTPPATLLVAIKLSVIVFGHERIVFYEQAIATVGATALVGWLTGGPVATLVDLAVLGVGTFLAFGRLGCFRVACCYGRPARRGVAYRDEHAAAGFPARWVGVRLLPIQLFDAALSAGLVALATWRWLAGVPAGTAACLYVAGYGLGRFGLELLRGDPIRPQLGGVSEAQWTALATAVGAAAWHPAWWSVTAAAVLALATATLALARRRGAFDRLWLAGAWHVHEVGRAIDGLVHAPAGPITTGLGLRLSAARLPDGRVDVVVSRPERPPSEAALAALAARLGRPWRRWRLQPGRTPGLVHLILEDR